MPGANYFLSQVAAQTPGPLLGAIVPPKLPSSPCLDIVQSPQIQPYISVIGSKTNTCRDVTPVTSDEIAAYGNSGLKVPKQQCSYSYAPSKYPVQYSARSNSLSGSSHNLSPAPAHNASTTSSLNISSVSSNNFPSAPTHPSIPPGLGTAHLPHIRKSTQENPVGELQELCTKMRWVFPTYYVYCDESQPHDRAFSVIVRLYRFREQAEAKSKRAAKREAARRILTRLRSWPTDASITFNSQMALPPPPSSVASSSGKELIAFQQSLPPKRFPPPSYFMNELSMLSQKHGFTAVFVPLEERTQEGGYQFMLQLSTWPVLVIHGVGRTQYAAKADAAVKALDSLRLLCKSYFTRQARV